MANLSDLVSVVINLKYFSQIGKFCLNMVEIFLSTILTAYSKIKWLKKQTVHCRCSVWGLRRDRLGVRVGRPVMYDWGFVILEFLVQSIATNSVGICFTVNSAISCTRHKQIYTVTKISRK